MRNLLSTCFLLLTQVCSAQIKLKELDKATIPAQVKYTGNLIHAARWTDVTGDNIVVLTTAKTKSKNAPDDGYSDAALYAYHYLVSPDSTKQTWKIYDYVKECPVDIFLYFIEKSFAVTDLDKNGKAEVWVMYKCSCQGDVSPVQMKLIMYENNKKYAARGTTSVFEGEGKYAGGKFSFDESFSEGPSSFRQYAENLWDKHKKEDWKQ